MKKLKYLLFVLAFSLIFIPGNVLAKTKEEAEEELNRLVIENQDGTCTWDVKMIDPEVLIKNTCNYTLESLNQMLPWLGDRPLDEQQEVLKNYIDSCKLSSVTSVFEVASRKVGNPNWSLGHDFSNGTPGHEDDYDYEYFNPNAVTFWTTYFEGYDEWNNKVYKNIERTCKVEYVENDKSIEKEAVKVAEKMTSNNIIYSLNTFNSVYHYGKIFENDTIDSEMILYKFPKFKKTLMENPEFKYEIAWEGGGGTPTETGCSGYVLIYRDGVPYAMKYVSFTMDNRFYVLKDLPGTAREKAEARLRTFFGPKVKIEFSDYYEEMNEEEYNMVGTFTYVTIGEYETPIFLMEVETDNLDEFIVDAFNKQFGVNVSTRSYDVPIDATLEVDDVMKKITLDTDEYKILSAYNIDVVKTGTGSYVKNVENGIDVFIPISGRKVGEKLKVFHVSEDSLDEEFVGEVVELDGLQYVKFTTTHFSTYAVADSVLTNPETSDTVVGAIILVLVGLLGFGLVYKLRPRRN